MWVVIAVVLHLNQARITGAVQPFITFFCCFKKETMRGVKGCC